MWCSSTSPVETTTTTKKCMEFLYNGVGRRKVEQSLDCSDFRLSLALFIFQSSMFQKVVSWVASNHFTGSILLDWISNSMNYSQTKDILRGHRQDSRAEIMWCRVKCIKNCRDTPNIQTSESCTWWILRVISNWYEMQWIAQEFVVWSLDAEIVQIFYRYIFHTVIVLVYYVCGVCIMDIVWCLCFNIEW